MSITEYLKKYYNSTDVKLSMAATVNTRKHLFKQLNDFGACECPFHTPYSNVKSYEIVKCGKLWVVVGEVVNKSHTMNMNISELALGIDKYTLSIWWEMNYALRQNDKSS
jgi:hypothetical protein